MREDKGNTKGAKTQFTHPVTGLLTTGRGVVFQKQNLGSGFFLRPGRVGSFDLQANP